MRGEGGMRVACWDEGVERLCYVEVISCAMR